MFTPEINLATLIIACIAAYFVLDRLGRYWKHERTQTFFKLFVTAFVWIPVFIISIFPGIAYSAIKSLGMENFNSVIFSGFVVVFILIFKLLSIIERLEHNITEIVRKEALKDLDNS